MITVQTAGLLQRDTLDSTIKFYDQSDIHAIVIHDFSKKKKPDKNAIPYSYYEAQPQYIYIVHELVYDASVHISRQYVSVSLE